MKNAGGKIADDRWHELPLATFKQVKGFRNLTHEDVVRLFEELRSVTMRHVNNAEGHTAIYGLIAVGRGRKKHHKRLNVTNAIWA